MASIARLRMIGGPNGSGKSTLIQWLVERASEEGFPLGFIQNPDLLQREIERTGRLHVSAFGIAASNDQFARFVRRHPLHAKLPARLPSLTADALEFRTRRNLGYLIPVLCDFLRTAWMKRSESFTFETVMSGADKLGILKDARAKKYRTYLYFVCTDNVRINRARIDNRVKSGGHAVPRAKVEERYRRSLRQLSKAIRLCDRAYIFDNSLKNIRLMAEFDGGKARWLASPEQPRWIIEHALIPSEAKAHK